ncbi:hypothetical protein B0T20DRAFT_481649 [Sordaria brevicollis]|uniref:Uncharacterized protein n=1 Tax=Sordaria brevicollis TaxID=83679 RepID=A0AAE0PB17_SORBR|nr:hypothetical protein B0T20DRAFT_481649 [Sordaria brevicollis]
MCHRKIVSFYCHCPLRNTALCPHSAHVNWDEYGNTNTTPNKSNHNNNTPTTTVVLSSPGFPPTPGTGTATPGAPSTTTPQNPQPPPPPPPQQEYCPQTNKPLFFHKRRPQDAQGAVHWDPLQSKTKWFPCASYMATHPLPGWAIPLHECEDCPEYFGDADDETKEVGVCEGCRGGHGYGHGYGKGGVVQGVVQGVASASVGSASAAAVATPVGASSGPGGANRVAAAPAAASAAAPATASEACSVRITKRGQRVTMLEILPRSFSAPEVVGKKEE